MKYPDLLDTLLRFGGWLAEGGTPQRADEGSPLTVADEVRADAWLRQWIGKPHTELPDPALRRALLPRFRYAALEISMLAKIAPADGVLNVAAELDRLLMRKWTEMYREMWLHEPQDPSRQK